MKGRRFMGAGLFAALWCIAGLATVPGLAQAAGLGGLLDVIKQKAQEAAQQVQPAPQQGSQPVPAPAAAAPLFSTRAPAGLRQLLGREVRGAELVTELTALRRWQTEQRSIASMGALVGTLEQAANAPAQGLSLERLGDVVADLGGKAVQAFIKDAAGKVATAALDDALRSLTDDPALLDRERVTLPPADGMSDAQMQRVVTMAALVVTAKATNRVFRQAQKDIAGIEDEYLQLIARRERAAGLLYQAWGQGAAAAVGDSLSAEDQAFLQTNLARLSAGEFANDLAAQNLALQFLRQRDPDAWADYAARRDGTLKRTQAYLRTVAGAAAVGGLSATFVREVGRASKERSLAQLMKLLPLGFEFLAEATPLIQLAAETTGSALGSAVQSTQRFSLTSAKGSQRVADAEAVFAALAAQGADRLFADALFRTGSPGLIQRVQVCDGPEAGRMLDRALRVKDRETFARAWFPADFAAGDFSFTNAFSPLPETASARERELPDRLLRADYRGERDAERMALGELQTQVARRHTKWTDAQLMRLVFANREGAAAHATLQLGELSLRPIPSMESIFVYEALIDACKSLLPR